MDHQLNKQLGYHANPPSLIELLPTFEIEMRSVKPKTFQVLKLQAEVGPQRVRQPTTHARFGHQHRRLGSNQGVT